MPQTFVRLIGIGQDKFNCASIKRRIETTVHVIGQGFGNNLTVSGGTFTNNGETYRAKSISCNMTDGVANITVTFPFSGEHKNVSMALTVNGADITFDLENFRNNALSVAVGSNPTSAKSSTIVINGNSSVASVIGNMKIYLDGAEITEAQLRELNPDTIASVEVNQVLKITSKKRK